VGPTYGSLRVNNFGLSLQVSSSNPTDRRVKRINTGNCYFYGVVVDPNTPTVTSTYNVYLVGYCYGTTKNRERGIAISKGTVQLGGDFPISWKEEDVYILDPKCYDVFTELNKPQLQLSKENGVDYIYVTVPGKCNAIYKVQNTDVSPWSPRLNNSYLPNTDPSMKDITIISSVFNPGKRIYFTSKKFNFDMSYLSTLDYTTMKRIETFTLQANESTPILALDADSDVVYVATAGFDKIYKFSSSLKNIGIAVLPSVLKPVDSMYFVNGSLYMVTYEPNAELGRISDQNFCLSFCSRFGYCKAGTCACIPDYDKDPRVRDEFSCAPTHFVKDFNTIKSEEGAAAAFGVLFVISIIAGVIGWFLWFRGQSYSKI